MRDIHCPKDIGLENTFSGEDCEKEQHYNNCYHCWSTALTKEIEMCKVDVLDKIKAEIEQMPSMLTEDGRRMVRRESVFWIIDKYRSESEDKE